MRIPVSGRSSRTVRHTSSPCTTGQVAVEHEHVVAHNPGFDQCLFAIRGKVDGESLAAQPSGDGIGQPQFVLGNQYAHQTSMTGLG